VTGLPKTRACPRSQSPEEKDPEEKDPEEKDPEANAPKNAAAAGLSASSNEIAPYRSRRRRRVLHEPLHRWLQRHHLRPQTPRIHESRAVMDPLSTAPTALAEGKLERK
jgi:hypothetical protein